MAADRTVAQPGGECCATHAFDNRWIRYEMDPLHSSTFPGFSGSDAASPAFHMQHQQSAMNRGAFQPLHDANQLITFQPPTCNAVGVSGFFAELFLKIQNVHTVRSAEPKNV